MTLTALPESPSELRQMMREGGLVQTTSGMAPGRVQANLAILPRDLAFDFLLFCQRNPRPCPLLEVVEAGEVEPREFAPGADLRSDTPLYRVYEHGELTAEISDISEFWRDDLVSFLLGCSFSFETALIKAGMEMRHMTCDTTVPMFITHPDVIGRRLQRADGRLDAPHPAGAGRPRRAGNIPLPSSAWRSRPCRRSFSHRHQ